MRSVLTHAATTWLGLVLLFAAAAAVLCVDLGRELLADSASRHRWVSVVAYLVVPLTLVLAGTATVVRIFTLA